ncbi:MAG: coenzyme F420-0:L-glutamate ligase [Deltaproteobacteria bacterium]|nr:coenzyme F420-0:L-glutamate ligase [Deltaproteobacteria bacterium]
MKLKAKAVTTKYWMPGTNYLEEIAKALKNKIKDGDIITVSEKAISTAIGNIVDESKIKPRKTAYLIAKYWMRIVWGYFLCFLARMKRENIARIRNYPLFEGARHKQTVIRYAGILQALNVWSENGIDGSNLPYAYVALPLRKAEKVAEKIRKYIEKKLGKKVAVMIVDTDKTYSFRNFHFTLRSCMVRGIFHVKCFLAYVFGRFLRLRRRATPVAVVGLKLDAENALRIAEFSNRLRGFGTGRTVWDMAQTFSTSLTGVSWEMLNRMKHKPIVIVRLVR